MFSFLVGYAPDPSAIPGSSIFLGWVNGILWVAIGVAAMGLFIGLGTLGLAKARGHSGNAHLGATLAVSSLVGLILLSAVNSIVP